MILFASASGKVWYAGNFGKAKKLEKIKNPRLSEDFFILPLYLYFLLFITLLIFFPAPTEIINFQPLINFVQE